MTKKLYNKMLRRDHQNAVALGDTKLSFKKWLRSQKDALSKYQGAPTATVAYKLLGAPKR